MRAGRLRHRVDIELDETPEGDVPTWTGKYAEDVPCFVQDVRGDKVFRGQQVESHITTVVEMRWDPALSNRLHRLNFGGRLLNIEYKQDQDGRERDMLVFCTETTG